LWWTGRHHHATQGGLDDVELDIRASVFTGPHWTLFFDSSSRVMLITPMGDRFKYMVHHDIKAANNMVEYEALIFGLSTALSLGVRQLLVKGDSQLIIK
jgi:hypothetical protein